MYNVFLLTSGHSLELIRSIFYFTSICFLN